MMRKQYHSRKSDKGDLTWDVHNLVELSKGLPVIEVPLSSIKELDENYWFAGEGDTPTCRAISMHFQLVQEVDSNYPIILSSDGRVMDGMHRVCKCLNAGHATIKAVQFTEDPEPDYVDVDIDTLPYD